MPTFDIVSELDSHEVSNAVDQANREVQNRYDFKGVDARFEYTEEMVTLWAEGDFQLQQMRDVLRNKLTSRKIDVRCLEAKSPITTNMKAKQEIILTQGLDAATGKKINKMIKDKKLKVQSQIQGEQVRVTGKKRDDLQAVMSMLREAELDIPLQFNNFRD